jgi:hypothetical protein
MSINFIDMWADLLEQAKNDDAFRAKLSAAPVEELAALGFPRETGEIGKALTRAVRAALDNPHAADVLRGGQLEAVSNDPGYLAVTPNWWGLVFTLSPQACSDLAAGLGVVAAVSGALALIPPAAPFAVVIGVAMGAAAGVITLVNRGKGVYITLLWASLALPAIPIIPTPVT